MKSSKRSAHVSEIVRRCLNTSRRLNWDEYFIPCLNDYMVRMKQAGFGEAYRRNVLLHAMNYIYDSKVVESDGGGVPLNRPSNYRKVERRKEKRDKKKQWNKKGGYTAPIIVPATPNSELVRMLKQIADQEKDEKLRFKIVEKGGRIIERSLVTPNPIGD